MKKVVILFGSLTGNTESVANKILTALETANINAILKNTANAQVEILEEADFLIVGASTWDDGMIQEDFASFLEEMGNKAPDIKNKQIAIFALGDSGYPQYCKAADILEEQFSKHGTKQVIKTLKIDGFPEESNNSEKIGQWIDELIQSIIN